MLNRTLPLACLALTLTLLSDAAFGQAEPVPAPVASKAVDPMRFGTRQPDEAYGAFQRGYYKTALDLALPRANAGEAPAQTLVAEILARGLGVKRDPAAAAKWYEKAAEQGVPEAQFQYALLLIDGKHVTRDKKAAYAAMQAAAEAGNALAQFNFAQLQIEQNPGAKGLELAYPYYERAAKADLPDAEYALSQLIARGIGDRKPDDVEARNGLDPRSPAEFRYRAA